MVKSIDMKTKPTESLSIKRANIVDKYLPAGDEQRYYERLKMHEELVDLINSHCPKIKQLEWRYDEKFFIWEANSVFGKYSFVDNSLIVNKKLFFRGREIAIVLIIDEAKAAAQADFEKRIKECLE